MATVKYLDENGLSTVWSKVKGIVTPKADKVSGATAGHLAGLNSSGNLTDSGLAATNVAQKDGSYSGMTVGAAEDLVSAESVASEFTSRITGGSTAVGKGGTALVDKIKGRTLVWNQLVQNGNFPSMDGWAVATSNTASVSGNKLTITCGSAENNNNCAQQYISILGQHYYYLSFYVKVTSSSTFSESFIGYFGAPTQWLGRASYNDLISGMRVSLIARAEGDHARLHVGVYGQYLPVSSTVEISDVKLIDLTLMFGAGYEPSTAAEFDALYPLPYYDHNTGALISNSATAIETVGWNQFDKDITVESLSVDGSGGSGTFRQVKRFKALAGTYFFNYVNNGNVFVKTVVNGTYGGAMGVNTSGGTTFTMSAPGEIWVYSSQAADLNSVSDQLCISLSDPSRNGTYEPYWRSELELGLGDIKVKSHNIWDEVWEAGAIAGATGLNDDTYAAQWSRSKNVIPVSANTVYYIRFGTTTQAYIYHYDSQGNYLGYDTRTTIYNVTGSQFTTGANEGYVRFAWAGTTYNNDTCINLSDPAFNGRYEPYGDGGVISITGGLKSAGVVYDEISGGKYIKRVGSVDMGDLSYLYRTEVEGGGVFSSTSIADKANGVSDKRYANVVCPMYLAAKSTTGVTLVRDRDNMTICDYAGATNIIYVKNLSYDGATAFKEAMAGVPLYYELAQPIEYELAEAIPTAMRNDPYGTERRLPEDTAAIVTAPFRADITYSTNIKEAVQSMHQNFINVNSMQDFLAELGAQMGGTWTMRPADGKFDFTFTPNPVEPTL